MINRVLRTVAIGVALVLLLAAGCLSYFTYTRFVRYQAAVDRIFATLSSDERQLSPASRRVLAKTEADSTRTYFVSVCLLSEVAPARVRMGEWHLRNALWVWLLPRRFDQEARLVLFAHFLPLEGGSGLAYGARRYFGKSPSDLTEAEALQLLAISYSPHAYSPTQHPERFRQRLNLVTERYRAAG